MLIAIARDSKISQRRLASELGIAVGLVNAYVKRCVRKGYLKVKEVPSRRYAYYVTPKGFSEKSRLTAEYLSASLTFFRRARLECMQVVSFAVERRWTHIALVGGGDLAEIAVLCALERGLSIVAIIDPERAGDRSAGVDIVASHQSVPATVDVYIITDLQAPERAAADISRHISADRILAPPMLGLVDVGPPLAEAG